MPKRRVPDQRTITKDPDRSRRGVFEETVEQDVAFGLGQGADIGNVLLFLQHAIDIAVAYGVSAEFVGHVIPVAKKFCVYINFGQETELSRRRRKHDDFT